MNPIVVALATTLVASSVIATEYNLSRRAIQIEIGSACQHLEEGQSMTFVRERLAENLKERGLTQVQIRQASQQIIKLIKRECN
jgi:hypothetical protein